MEIDVQLTVVDRPRTEQSARRAAVLDAHAAPRPGRPSQQTATPEPRRHRIDVVEEWGLQSFPASDPPANW
jgi:hypothetical protein